MTSVEIVDRVVVLDLVVVFVAATAAAADL